MNLNTWICWRSWPIALLVTLLIVCVQDAMRHPESYVAQAAELLKVDEITIDTGTFPLETTTEPLDTIKISIDWDVPPKDCESQLYRWDGEQLRCATVDRLGILQIQRNHNMRALDWKQGELGACQKHVVYLRGEQLLAAMHNDARAKCREMGKVFDETKVICTGSLTPGEVK